MISVSAVAVLVLGITTRVLAVDVDPSHVKVVIVGAGAAGISAAQKLLEKGLDVTLLEAAEQIGGRIQSANLSDGLAPDLKGWVEIGPQYVYALGELPSWLIEHDYTEEIPEQVDVFYSDERGLLEGDVASTARDFDGLFTQMVSPMEDKYFPKTDKRTFSVGSYLDDSFKHMKEDDDLQKVDETAKGLLDVCYDINIRGHKTTVGADSLYDVAVEHYNVLKMSSIDLKQLNKPFSDIFKRYASSVSSDKIKLETVVTGIKFDKKTKSDHPVTVTTSDGKTIAAHHVIFTGSLGVLKADHEKLFKPKLSPQRVKAINSMGFGKVEKLFAVYEKPFWLNTKKHLTGMGFLWDKDLKVDVERRYADKPWHRSIESITVAPHAENVLEIELAGEVVESEIFRDEKKLAADLTKFLRTMSRNKNIPKPKSVTVTSWWANPFTRGTKSYLSHECVADNCGPRDLSKSAWEYEHTGRKVPALMFAGEATHPKYFSTIQGAIESGWREANRLIKAYNL